MFSNFPHILVTGGVGSVGRSVILRLLENHPEVKRITIFSRDEHKQNDMLRELSLFRNRLRFMIGDIRDFSRFQEAIIGVDAVIHAAAMRLVPSAEENPYECIRTNVEGTRNLILLAKNMGVKKVVSISSDKAVIPTTTYGSSKFLMERILLDADRDGDTRFSIVRYANILSSRSSVAPLFLSLRGTGTLPITDLSMTRFSITMEEGVDLILHALAEGWGGDIICPICPSYRVGDMAKAIAPEAKYEIIGARPGEKLHEAMYNAVEAPFAARNDRFLVIAPTNGRWSLSDFISKSDSRNVACIRDFLSCDNDKWLSVEDLKALILREFN